MPELLKQVAIIVLMPILLFASWTHWLRAIRVELPPWRNGVALTSLLILSLNWITAVVLDIPVLLKYEIHAFSDMQCIAYHLSPALAAAATVFAFTLKGRARLESILAGFLMITCWPGGYV